MSGFILPALIAVQEKSATRRLSFEFIGVAVSSF